MIYLLLLLLPCHAQVQVGSYAGKAVVDVRVAVTPNEKECIAGCYGIAHYRITYGGGKQERTKTGLINWNSFKGETVIVGEQVFEELCEEDCVVKALEVPVVECIREQ